jgi:ubiquitin C-terminal hydrolase
MSRYSAKSKQPIYYSSLFDSRDKEKNENYEYTLFSICNHMGKMSSGHYTAIAKHHLSHQWLEFDDKNVKDYNEDLVTNKAYLLFYSKAN